MCTPEPLQLNTTKGKCSISPFTCILKFLIRSLECPESEKFISRFEDQLNQLIAVGGVNVSVRELADLIKLISLTFQRIDEKPAYLEAFYKLLNFSSQNLVFLITSDMISYAEIIQDFFNMLGYLLGSTENLDCIQHILNSILKMIAMAKKKPYLQSKVLLDAFANSQIPPIFSELLYISEFDVYIKYLTVLEKFFVSESICQAFLKCKVFDTVVQRVCLKWRDEINYPDEVLPTLDLPPHLNVTQRILWTLTMIYNDSSTTFKNSIGYLVEGSSLRGPRNVLITLITSNKDKHMRNMFYLLLRAIAGTVPFRHYRSLNNELHILTFTTEVEQSHPWAKRMVLRADDLDFEFKMMLVSMLCINRVYPQSLDLFRKMNAVQGIFTLIDTDIQLIWSTYQRLELMKGALIGMENMIFHVIDDYIHYGGPGKLLKVLTKVVEGELHSTLLLPILRCINTSLNVPSNVQEKVAKLYRMKHIIEILTTTIENVINAEFITKLNLSCLAVSYCILEKVAKPNEPKLTDVTKTGIAILKKYLNPDPSISFLAPKVLIAVMSFIWENVVYCENGIHEFSSTGGVYVILDIIEKFPLAIKVLGLSMIADFCQIQEFLSCILTWKGKSEQTIVPFLLDIYKDQARFDKDHTDIKSTLQDLENPIFGDKYNEMKKNYINNEYASFATLDFLGNCKPSIYAILTLLRCDEDKELINNTYKISKENLTNKEKIVAALAENYLPLSIGESWIEVNQHFQTKGVRPLVFDQILIAAKLQEHRERAKLIQIDQLTCEISENNREICVERQFYERLREEVLNESLDALNELRYYTRCVDTMARLEQCTQLTFETENVTAGRLDKSMLVDYHKTLPEYINITPHFNQHVSIQSNVIIDPNKEKTPDAVSLDSTEQGIIAAKKFADLMRKRAPNPNPTSYDVTRSKYARYYSVDFH
nr:uncharacterized protein LOC111417487 [Onthophagus taurus]